MVEIIRHFDEDFQAALDALLAQAGDELERFRRHEAAGTGFLGTVADGVKTNVCRRRSSPSTLRASLELCHRNVRPNLLRTRPDTACTRGTWTRWSRSDTCTPAPRRPSGTIFAAGEITGGVHGGNRIGGNAVADIVTFGRIAGTNASAYAKAH